MKKMKIVKLGSYVIVVLLMLLIAASVEAAPKAQGSKYPFSALKPVSGVYIQGLSDLGNIRVNATFKCGGLHRADWNQGGAWVKLTTKAFAFYASDGLLHIHVITYDPPASLNGARPGNRYRDLPDYALHDVDGNVPLESVQYRAWYRRWQTRPCVDITESLLSNPKYAKAWSWLVKRNQSEAVRWLLEEMGLEADTGLLPYSLAGIEPRSLDEAFADIVRAGLTDSSETSYAPITNEGVYNLGELTNEGEPYVLGYAYEPGIANDQWVSGSPGVSLGLILSALSLLLTFVGKVLVTVRKSRKRNLRQSLDK